MPIKQIPGLGYRGDFLLDNTQVASHTCMARRPELPLSHSLNPRSWQGGRQEKDPGLESCIVHRTRLRIRIAAQKPLGMEPQNFQLSLVGLTPNSAKPLTNSSSPFPPSSLSQETDVPSTPGMDCLGWQGVLSERLATQLFSGLLTSYAHRFRMRSRDGLWTVVSRSRKHTYSHPSLESPKKRTMSQLP